MLMLFILFLGLSHGNSEASKPETLLPIQTHNAGKDAPRTSRGRPLALPARGAEAAIRVEGARLRIQRIRNVLAFCFFCFVLCVCVYFCLKGGGKPPGS